MEDEKKLWEFIPKTEWIEVKAITPYANNAKKHPKSQIEAIAESIRINGWVQPLVIDKNNLLVIGHGRLEAAKLLGAQSVPCFRAEHLTDLQVRALRLADNKLNESDWDMELVKMELKDFPIEAIKLAGFNPDIILEADPDDESTPEIPEVPKSKLGEIYQLGEHRLMCGDSTKLEDVEKLMGGKFADLLITDPPYNLDYDFGNNGMVQTGSRKSKHGKIKNDNMSDEDFRIFLANLFDCAYRHMKPGASFYVFGRRESTINFNRSLDEKDFHVAQWLVWKKENFNISRLSYHPSYEIISYGWKKGEKHAWYGGRSQRDVIDQAREPIGTAVHPTQKPVDLLTLLIANSSKEGELVLDLFGGSGSTLIACEKAKRRCFTMELDPKYVDVIIQRWENYTKQKAVKLPSKTA